MWKFGDVFHEPVLNNTLKTQTQVFGIPTVHQVRINFFKGAYAYRYECKQKHLQQELEYLMKTNLG